MDPSWVSRMKNGPPAFQAAKLPGGPTPSASFICKANGSMGGDPLIWIHMDGTGYELMSYTLPKFNIDPENKPSQ